MKILVITGYYKPAYKAGGPVKSISNLVENLEDFKFNVVTSDRDLADVLPFEHVIPGSWQNYGGASVMYLSPKQLSFNAIAKLINETSFDVLYLNSFFDSIFSIKPLLAMRIGKVKPCPVVLAPRGEFSKGAMEIKPFKKRLFIRVSSWIGLYQGVLWQASSEFERQDIIDALSVKPDSVLVAKNLSSRLTNSDLKFNYRPSKVFKIVFLSRLSPKKNLDYALKCLAFVTNEAVFDIYGPKEDEAYWKICLKLIEALPTNITVNYYGSVKSDQVAEIFSRYDLFFFPTRGENYGHVIAESLSVGTPVLISNQTPWRDLADDNIGWDLPLNSMKEFVKKIEIFANLSSEERASSRQIIFENGLKRVNSNADLEANRRLFEFAVERFNLDKV
ncbi:glycosyltransferase, partial [Thiomicrospira pelophila]|uniref:glycosyltransferase n=1 Tax=Thiomicrospira pelophila TaxID=934 RepID=UPI0004A715FE